MKKNNKGFSLVELIVVVLIMAIIAVALAPQVMKWVENSRKSTDCNNYDSVVSAVNIALANEAVMTEISTAGATVTWAGVTGGTWTVSLGNTSALFGAIADVLGDTWNADLKLKRTTDIESSGYVITISSNGTVTRTTPPSANVS